MLRDIYKGSKYAISKVIIFDCSLKKMSDVGNYEKYNVFIRKKDKVSSTLSGGGGGVPRVPNSAPSPGANCYSCGTQDLL